MYHFSSRVRYSEISKNKELDLTSLINYFQDCSTFQSEDAGVGIAFLEKQNRSWVMNAWQIVIQRLPMLSEYIKVSTWPYDFKGLYGYRNFRITDVQGQVCAIANSIWVNYDTRLKRPIKVNPQDVAAYALEERIDMAYAPRKIVIPENSTALEGFPVVASNIDTNHHVNNGQYIKMAENYLPDEFKIRQLRAEYRKSAVSGDTIVPLVHEDERYLTVTLSDGAGHPYAIVEFEKGV